MNIRLASPLEQDSVSNGEGIRTVIWTQGCNHHCLGCHNPETHTFDKGKLIDINELKNEISSLQGQDGITLSGGDPLMQPNACYEIAKHAKEIGLNVWCYTGYTFEEVLKLANKNKLYKNLLEQIDVLIDGKFVLEQMSLNLKYRGSTNQRIIDVKQSLDENKVIEITKYDSVDTGIDLYTKPDYIFV